MQAIPVEVQSLNNLIFQLLGGTFSFNLPPAFPAAAASEWPIGIFHSPPPAERRQLHGSDCWEPLSLLLKKSIRVALHGGSTKGSEIDTSPVPHLASSSPTLELAPATTLDSRYLRTNPKETFSIGLLSRTQQSDSGMCDLAGLFSCKWIARYFRGL
jgi:hypothetical protein